MDQAINDAANTLHTNSVVFTVIFAHAHTVLPSASHRHEARATYLHACMLGITSITYVCIRIHFV